MRLRTMAVFAALVLVLGAVAGVTVTRLGADAALSEEWVSDTPRNTSNNHHSIGAADGVVVAPVAERTADDLSARACSLVRLGPTDGAVQWRYSIPPDRCFIHALTRPAIADVDADDSLEVVAATTENVTVVLDAETGREQARIPMPTYGYGRPTVADLRGDDRPAIVASDLLGNVVAAGGDGTVRWRANVTGPVWDTPLVAPVGPNGATGLVIGANRRVTALSADGERLWRRNVSGTDVALAETADGPSRLVAAGDELVGLDPVSGERVWRRDVRGSAQVTDAVDGDGDGADELYVSLPGNLVAAYDAGGERLWQTRLAPAETTVTPPPALGDLTGDGSPELVAVTNGGRVAVLDPTDGATLATYEREVPIWTAPTVANATADPGGEALVRYGDGRVVALPYEE